MHIRLSMMIFLGLSSSVLAHGKHVHDEAEMSIAVDGKKVSVLFESPGISIYGFEREPKDAKEMARREAAIQKLIKGISQIVAFDAALGCKLKKHDVIPLKVEEEDGDKNSGHGNLEGTFNFECDKNPKNGGAMIKISHLFPDVKKLDVTIASDKQSSVQVGKAGARVSF